MTYYRVSKNVLEVGSIIWEVEIDPKRLEVLKIFINLFSENNQRELDRIFLNSDLGMDWYNLMKEAALEVIRREKYTELPSRFENMMVFADLDDAINFRKRFCPAEIIYKLKYPSNAKFFTADMNMIDIVGGSNPYRKMAENYWAAKMTDQPIKETILGVKNKAVVTEKLMME